MILLFVAGFLVAALGTAEVLAIAKRRALSAAGLEIAVVWLWLYGLSAVVVDKTNAVPYALGAALGTYIVTRRHRPTDRA